LAKLKETTKNMHKLFKSNCHVYCFAQKLGPPTLLIVSLIVEAVLIERRQLTENNLC